MSTSENNPFRDELAAAHAKLASVEAELHELRTVAQPYLRQRRPRNIAIPIVLVILLTLAALSIGFVAGQSNEQGAERARGSAASSTSTARSTGLAAAGPPTAPEHQSTR